ncbi:succinylglutamate desuccinylase/aspartoacylase family protein [uncultured Algibacter sp.]|uniref:succinylglutamate desuccinylase/aspartoacylase family protein n=1 Tax=uncultured Algibacter sp. TaxID=298659 RepID=UPI002625EE36|nr:succinylglutamate desuccinylase/aspartoacylase family protein [uncultured Algibacter sp.]
MKRIIKEIHGEEKGPTLVFFGGIHGNEKAGVIALQEVLKNIKPDELNGSIYAISGNLKALEKNQRYINQDLNRLWTRDNINTIKNKNTLNNEEKELLKLLYFLERILKIKSGPFYFFDLHTTSSKTLPFITINDALINRKFSKLFPVPIVLGIEEYLNGPLLSYINTLGYLSLGFESGQHVDVRSIENNLAFINLVLHYTGAINKAEAYNLEYYNQLKEESKSLNRFFEITHLHSINKKDSFKMYEGFKSFQKINKGAKIARNNKEDIYSKHDARIFMPLYQKKGAEGFFIIRDIKPFYLKMSIFLRRIKIDNLLVLFPGISWQNKREGVLKVNLKVAKFFAKPIFHALGYRNRQVTKTHMNLYNRERVAKTRMYKEESWY